MQIRGLKTNPSPQVTVGGNEGLACLGVKATQKWRSEKQVASRHTGNVLTHLWTAVLTGKTRTLVHLHFSLHAGGQVRDVHFSSCNASQVMHCVNGAGSSGGDEEWRHHISAIDRFLLCVPARACVHVCECACVFFFYP